MEVTRPQAAVGGDEAALRSQPCFTALATSLCSGLLLLLLLLGSHWQVGARALGSTVVHHCRVSNADSLRRGSLVQQAGSKFVFSYNTCCCCFYKKWKKKSLSSGVHLVLGRD